MSDKTERAVAMFVEGYSCAQSLLATYGPDLVRTSCEILEELLDNPESESR